jgi:putative DNA primase/helicase
MENTEPIIENTESIEDTYLNSKQIQRESDDDLLNHALHYARAGYPVILLHNLEQKNGVLQCSCSNGTECLYSGKHPRTRNGSNDATTDEQRILHWWEKYPSSNIGLLAGKEVGFFVLDIDIRTEPIAYNGELALEEMREQYKALLGGDYSPLPETLTARSGSGSRHLYFRYNLDLDIKNSASKIGEGLDIKSDGNYIVAPPSNHKSTNKYRWFGVNTQIEDAPDWLHYEIQVAMREADSKSTSVSSAFSRGNNNEKISVGKRNVYLCKKICGLVNNFRKEEVLRRALVINDEKFTEPLTVKEVERTVNWAWKKFVKTNERGMREPD